MLDWYCESGAAFGFDADDDRNDLSGGVHDRSARPSNIDLGRNDVDIRSAYAVVAAGSAIDDFPGDYFDAPVDGDPANSDSFADLGRCLCRGERSGQNLSGYRRNIVLSRNGCGVDVEVGSGDFGSSRIDEGMSHGADASVVELKSGASLDYPSGFGRQGPHRSCIE